MSQQLAVVEETFDMMVKEPLRAAPLELRPAVYAAWLPFRTKLGMETPLDLAVMVGLWVTRHGFTAPEIKAALEAVTHPRHAQKIQFGHHLIVEIAGLLCPPAPKREETMEERALRVRAELHSTGGVV